jgi:hypothetical protein
VRPRHAGKLRGADQGNLDATAAADDSPRKSARPTPYQQPDGIMADHKFLIGDAVEYFASRRFDRLAGGLYTVVRLFPVEGNTPQYRIKSAVDGRERMVRESEIGPRG